MALSGCKVPKLSILGLLPTIERDVNPLRLLVDLFVNTFGITPPTPEHQARAGRVIAMMLAAVLVLLVGVAWLLRTAFVR